MACTSPTGEEEVSSRLEVREVFGRSSPFLAFPEPPRRHGWIRPEIPAQTHPRIDQGKGPKEVRRPGLLMCLAFVGPPEASCGLRGVRRKRTEETRTPGKWADYFDPWAQDALPGAEVMEKSAAPWAGFSS